MRSKKCAGEILTVTNDGRKTTARPATMPTYPQPSAPPDGKSSHTQREPRYQAAAQGGHHADDGIAQRDQGAFRQPPEELGGAVADGVPEKDRHQPCDCEGQVGQATQEIAARLGLGWAVGHLGMRPRERLTRESLAGVPATITARNGATGIM